MSALEQRSKKAFDQCSLLADLVEKTESNGKKFFPIDPAKFIAGFKWILSFFFCFLSLRSFSPSQKSDVHQRTSEMSVGLVQERNGIEKV